MAEHKILGFAVTPNQVRACGSSRECLEIRFGFRIR